MAAVEMQASFKNTATDGQRQNRVNAKNSDNGSRNSSGAFIIALLYNVES